MMVGRQDAWDELQNNGLDSEIDWQSKERLEFFGIKGSKIDIFSERLSGIAAKIFRVEPEKFEKKVEEYERDGNSLGINQREFIDKWRGFWNQCTKMWHKLHVVEGSYVIHKQSLTEFKNPGIVNILGSVVLNTEQNWIYASSVSVNNNLKIFGDTKIDIETEIATSRIKVPDVRRDEEHHYNGCNNRLVNYGGYGRGNAFEYYNEHRIAQHFGLHGKIWRDHNTVYIEHASHNANIYFGSVEGGQIIINGNGTRDKVEALGGGSQAVEIKDSIKALAMIKQGSEIVAESKTQTMLNALSGLDSRGMAEVLAKHDIRGMKESVMAYQQFMEKQRNERISRVVKDGMGIEKTINPDEYRDSRMYEVRPKNMIEGPKIHLESDRGDMVVDYVIKMKEEIKIYIEGRIEMVKFLDGLKLEHQGRVEMAADEVVMDDELKRKLFEELGINVKSDGGQILSKLAKNTEEVFAMGKIVTKVGDELSPKEVAELDRVILWPVWLENWQGYGRVLGLKVYFNMNSLRAVHIGSNIESRARLELIVEGEIWLRLQPIAMRRQS